MAPTFLEKSVDGNTKTAKIRRTSNYPSPHYEFREGQRTMPVWEMEEDIVISGISGRFAEADSMQELRENLMNGVDMVVKDDKRWPAGIFGLPERIGKLKDLSKFDATFFGINPKQVECMDPSPRIVLEATYEAIVDAGVNPNSLRGKRIGVFLACSHAETEEALTKEVEKNSGYLSLGCSRALFANRISFVFDFKGPSYMLDTGCSGSLMAMDQAVFSLRNGQCEAAVVAGVNISLNPIVHSNFNKLGMLSKQGQCKTFDIDVTGYVKSEAITVAYLQKHSEAKRNYATIVHIKTNTDGYKEQGITYPNGAVQKKLLEDVYEEAAVDPADIEYVEAHGTGTKAGDFQETNAIADFFCKGRKGPLLIGSVKSNMGHTEAAAGLCALAKMVIAMEDGIIPANLHFSIPNPEIPGLFDGRLKVVSENTPYKGGLLGINSFGYGGVNVHVILKPNTIEKVPAPPSEGQKLFNFSGRTEESVSKMLSYVEAHADDYYLRNLLSEPALSPLGGHPYRGYTIMNGDNTIKEIQYCEPHNKPIWYVYPGMGTQWTGMGRDLMQIEIFRDTVLRVHEILKPYDIDMYKLIMEGDETTFDEILNSFVVIACIQVALTNILRHLGIEPDGTVGHSVGELGCAYADGCFSEEEMVMSAYWRGWHVKNSSLPPGAMAAVGLTWEDATERCPKGVVPACHNAEDSVTISGSAQEVNAFVKDLKAEGKFAKAVNSSGFAFHCYYMSEVASGLNKSLEKTIPNPKPRTSRWASSSIPESRWDTPLAQTSSAAYFVNNLVSPVLFHTAMSHVPKNAIVIEVAPHSLLQSILKRTLGPDCTFFGLMKRNETDSVSYLLSTLGKMYIRGMNPDVSKLFPATTFPVPRGTPMISPKIEWDHSQTWTVAKAEQFIKRIPKSGSDIDISSKASKDYYLVGHTIDGRVLYPATGYLVLAWKEFARMKGKEYVKLPVVFEDVMLHRATILPKTGTISFTVNVTEVEGQFEISEGGSVAVTGRIYEPETSDLQYPGDMKVSTIPSNEYLPLKSKDIYKALRLIGYEYGPTFQGIMEADNAGTRGKIRWDGNWISYLDTVLQFSIIGTASRNLRLPTRIEYMKINPQQHEKAIVSLEEGAYVPVEMDGVINICVSGGVEARGMKASIAPRRPLQQSDPVLEEHHFVPLLEKTCLNARDGNEQQMKQYADLCTDFIIQKSKDMISQGNTTLFNQEYLLDITKRPSKVKNVEEVVETFLSETSLNASLLKVLRDVLFTKVDSNFKTNAVNIIQQRMPELQDDSLLVALLDQRIIRTCLDLVLENIPPGKIKIVEADAVRGNLFPKIVAILMVQPLAQVDCHATDVNPHQLSSTDLEKYNAKSAKWDFTTEDAPKGARGAHLVFANGVLASNINAIRSCLQNLTSALKEGGFLLLLERTEDYMPAQYLDAISGVLLPQVQRDDLLKAFEAEGLELISEKGDGILSSIFLLRKVSNSLENLAVVSVEENIYENWLDKVKGHLDKLQKQNADARLWLVAHDTTSNGIIGMVNCLRQEGGGDKIRCIFNPFLERSKVKLFESNPVKALKGIYENVLRKDLMTNVYRDGVWGTYRHIPLKHDKENAPVEADHSYVNILSRGDLSSLRWMESPLKYSSCMDIPVCHVYYSALNFRDIMLATGKINTDSIPGDQASKDCVLGLEYSGRDNSGKRIMGLVTSKGLATTVPIDPLYVWPVPEQWSLEEAATVPVVYATVYYSFFSRGNLQKGETVLIHAGSGGVGQAAIAVALSIGCEVFTTVSSKEKRDYLKSVFPQLKDRNFANSRDTSFENAILRETGGRGVDVVLNSLSEDKMMASIRLLTMHGRFLEIGKFDLSKNTPLGMEIFLRNVSFHGVLLDRVMSRSEPETLKMVDMVSEGIKSGVVKPLRRTVFEKDQVEAAFRFMASGKHIGKVLVKIRDEEQQKMKLPLPLKLKSIPRTTFYQAKSYVVTGGLGGFGLELCDWLVVRGARNLVLSSRTGIRDGYQSRCVRNWKEQGIQVLVSKHDVVTEDGAAKLLSEAATLGPVGGIFNLAMVLKDGFMENQTVENFITVCNPKVKGTHNLDKASRKLCPKLDFFVVFSSVSCGRGNAGQSNYGFANSVMERICELRKKDRLPGLAIQWGGIGDVGVILENMGGNDLVIGGTLPQRIISCMTTMDRFLNQPHPVVSSYVLAQRQGSGGAQSGKTHNLIETIANILGIKDVSSISPMLTLGDLGMDSLMGVEIKHALERNFNSALSINDIRQLNMKMLHDINNGEADSSAPATEQEQEKETEAEVKVQRPESAWKSPVVKRFDIQNLVATKCIVALNKVTKGFPIFIVHPIEGVTMALEPLASKLGCPVYGIQCTSEAPLETMEGLAAYYIQQIQATQPRGPYRISGYSYGATVAFEIAFQMQNAHPDNPDIVEHLLLLDGSHNYSSTLIEYYRLRFQFKDISQSDADLLCVFILQFIPINYEEVKAELLSIPTMNDKMDHVANKLMKTGKFKSHENIVTAAEIYQREMMTTILYTPSGKFNGKVTLLRALQNVAFSQSLGNDYGLGDVCTKKVQIHAMDGDHDTFILGSYGEECAKVINSIFCQ